MKSIGEFLVDSVFYVGALFDRMRRNRKPGEMLQFILERNPNMKEGVNNLRAEDFNHPWYARWLTHFLREDLMLDNAASEKEKEIVKKVRR